MPSLWSPGGAAIADCICDLKGIIRSRQTSVSDPMCPTRASVGGIDALAAVCVCARGFAARGVLFSGAPSTLSQVAAVAAQWLQNRDVALA